MFNSFHSAVCGLFAKLSSECVYCENEKLAYCFIATERVSTCVYCNNIDSVCGSKIWLMVFQ